MGPMPLAPSLLTHSVSSALPQPATPPIDTATLESVATGISSEVDAPLLVAQAYQLGVVILLSIGLYFCIKTMVMMSRNWTRLSPVIKYHTVVIAHDVSMCVNFITRDLYHLWYGVPLQSGAWCQISAFWAMTSVTSLYLSAAGVAYATYHLTDRRPLSTRAIVAIHAGSLLAATCMTLMVSGTALGPYKGLYCAMEMDGQELSTTMPFIVVYTASLGLMSFWYTKSFKVFKQPPKAVTDLITRASAMLLSEGITLMVLSQATWVLLLLNGMVTAAGFHVHYTVDIAAAWVAKLQPSVDSIVLLHMMQHGVTLVKQAEYARKDRQMDNYMGGEDENLSAPPCLVFDLTPFGDLLTSKSRALLNHALVRRFLDSIDGIPLLTASGAPKTSQPPPDLTGMTTLPPEKDGKYKQGSGPLFPSMTKRGTYQRRVIAVFEDPFETEAGQVEMSRGLNLLQQKQRATALAVSRALPPPCPPRGTTNSFYRSSAEENRVLFTL